MSKQHYWFKVHFGKWEDDQFDPDVSFVYTTAWDAVHAAKKALKNVDSEGEIITTIQLLGYPQVL